jgi:predicted TPR repeat methyltransferase
MIADRRYAYGRDCLKEGDAGAATDLFRQTLELTPAWPPAWFALGEAMEMAGDIAGAIAAFESARRLSPDDTLGAGARLARLGLADAAMSLAYVAALFDEYAGRFDAHLVKALDYRGPAIVAAALRAVCDHTGRDFHFERAADLGCGTGLMAADIWTCVDAMFGVDLSPAMTEQARRSGYYAADGVVCGDIVPFLEAQGEGAFDLLLAADVFVYIGDLGPVLSAAQRVMDRGALFAFTVQSHAGDGFILGPDLRYHHSETDVRRKASASGLDVLHLEPCVTRQDAGKPVRGFMVVLGRQAAVDGR